MGPRLSLMLVKSSEDIAAANAPAATVVPVVVTHVPSADDVTQLLDATHEHIEQLLVSELRSIQGTIQAAWKQAEQNLAAAQNELAALKREHAALKVLHAEAERKVALLDQLKKELAGI